MYYLLCIAVYAIIISCVQKHFRDWSDKSAPFVGGLLGGTALLFIGYCIITSNVPETKFYEVVVSRQIAGAFPAHGDTFIMTRAVSEEKTYLQCKINYGTAKGWQQANFSVDSINFVHTYFPDQDNTYEYLRLRTKSGWRRLLFFHDLEDWTYEDSNKGIYRLYISKEPEITQGV